MLNPSTADAETDDATIRSCIRLCRSWGHGGLEVINLYGWRATDPGKLSGVTDPVGPKNDLIAEVAIKRCDLTICAWGAHHAADKRAAEMLRLIRRHRPAAFCLGTTRAGAPKHPLYVKTGTPLVMFSLPTT